MTGKELAKNKTPTSLAKIRFCQPVRRVLLRKRFVGNNEQVRTENNMSQIEIIKVPEWEQFEWLRHGFSTRGGGLSTVYGGNDLNLGVTKEDDPDLVAQNRKLFLRVVAPDPDLRMQAVLQVHGTRVMTVTPASMTGNGSALIEADGMVTSSPGVMLGVKTADCVPVLLADTRQRVVAAIHAGWRGTAAGIVEQGVAKMSDEFGSRMEDLVGAVGPSIRACCYTVGEEVRTAFEARYRYAGDLFEEDGDGLKVNLWDANRKQMVDAGLRPERVSVLAECTACARVRGRRKYFSHRAEKGFTGRGLGAIGIVG